MIAVRDLSARVKRGVVLAVVAAIVAGGVFYVFFDGQTRKVVAHFSAAVGVYPGSDVRMLGVKVGTVTTVTPQGGSVRVAMKYESKYKVPANAVAVIVSNSLVADRFVQLAPAYNGGPVLANGADIPLSRTAAPVELDDIYAALNTLSSALGPNGANKNGALSDLINVSAANLQGNGQALGQSIQNLSAAAQTLSDGREDLFGTVKNLQAFTAALSASDTQVRHFNDQLAQVAAELADERESLAAALSNLTAALNAVSGFIKNNQTELHLDITGLESVTNVLVKDKAALNEILTVAPTALSNLAHTYNPSSGTLDTRDNLDSLTDPAVVCAALVQQVGAYGLAGLGGTVAQTCTAVAQALNVPLSGLVGLLGQLQDGLGGLTTLPGCLVKRAVALAVAGSFALTGCHFAGLYSTSLPGGADLGNHPYSVTIDFADVLDLVPQSAVKVNDVSVGRVDSISLDGWQAKVKVTVNGDVSLPANAHAELAQTSLLGEKYVELEQPTGAAPTGTLKSGDTIPIQRTTRNPEVEEVLGALSLVLNGGGLAQIKTIVHELDQALAGHSAQVRDLLTQLTSFVGDLDQQKDQITTAIDNVNTLAATLNQQKQVLASTLDTLPGALTVLADERDQLVGLLSSLSNLGSVATNVINASSADFTSALRELDPVATSLVQAGSNLPDAIKILLTFPFPPDVTNAIRGDYVNADITLDLNLTDALSNQVNPSLGQGPAVPTGTTSSPVPSGTTGQSATNEQLPPSLPGVGG